ncbi:hypothetical protein PLEOSDRAFT_161738 [Pleurotus ostreatus PC15]|uniref:Uncharacterized protein n=1 Tax=Pleurotus ostreatus (strain PC15) TaxID=1137138 RepID=A0A067NJB4_PLEO1|nr:hypothetical protein PLEOSDRAFT_161738 [Pleurotus ostreatus PC15]
MLADSATFLPILFIALPSVSELALQEDIYTPLAQWTLSSKPKIADMFVTEALDEYIKGLTELDGDDTDFVDDVKEVHRALASTQAEAQLAGPVPNFKVFALGGTLHFDGPKFSGSGPCEKKGSGGFYVNKTTMGGRGTYKLYFERFSVKLELYSGNKLVDTIKGNGAQKGLSNREGKPWEGTWS